MAFAETKTIALGAQTLSYRLNRSKSRRRTLSLRVNAGGLIIRTPIRTALKEIESFISKNADWIFLQLARVQQEATEISHDLPESIYFLGEVYPLELIEDGSQKPDCRIEHGVIKVILAPEPVPARRKAAFIARLHTWYRSQAQHIYMERLDHFKGRFNVEYARLFITNPIRQWGSCTAHNDIRLNWRLIMAPLRLIDYVVAHELVHVLHKNHSQRFWRTLGDVMPDYTARRRELHEFGRSSAMQVF